MMAGYSQYLKKVTFKQRFLKTLLGNTIVLMASFPLFNLKLTWSEDFLGKIINRKYWYIPTTWFELLNKY